MVFILFQNIKTIYWYDVLGLFVALFFMGFTLVMFIITSSRAKEMDTFARKMAVENLKKRQAGDRKKQYAGAKEFRRILFYFLYPKHQDWHKALLVVLGFAVGSFLAPEAVCGDRFMALLQCLFVFEFLAYRARYQINDLRGVQELENPLHKVKGTPNPNYIRISFWIALTRIVLAIVLTAVWNNPTRGLLTVALWLLLGSTIFYELARWGQEAVRKRWEGQWEKSWIARFFADCIYFLVGAGYPLRFFLGLSLVIPWCWTPVSCGLIVALWAYGSDAALLTWACAVAKTTKQEQADNSKGHFLLIRDTLEARKQAPEEQRKKSASVLQRRGQIREPWNVSYLIATLAISFTIRQTGEMSLGIAVLEAVGVLLFACAAVAGSRAAILSLAVAGFITVLKIFIIAPALANPRPYLCLCGMQMLFAATHFYLRFFISPQDLSRENKKPRLRKHGLVWVVAGSAARDALCSSTVSDGESVPILQEEGGSEKVEI